MKHQTGCGESDGTDKSDTVTDTDLTVAHVHEFDVVLSLTEISLLLSLFLFLNF